MIPLPKGYLEVIVPAFCVIVSRCGRHIIRVVVDGRLWGFTGDDLRQWTSNIELFVNCLRAHGVNVEEHDHLVAMLQAITDSPAGT